MIGPRGNGVGKFGEGRTDVHDEGGMRKAFMALNCLLECVNIVVRDPSDIRAQFCLHRTCFFFFFLLFRETKQRLSAQWLGVIRRSTLV